MAGSLILFVRDGVVLRGAIPKLDAPRTQEKWFARVRRTAFYACRPYGAKYFAWRFSGQWHVFRAPENTFHALVTVRSFPAGQDEGAVEMYLIHKEAAHG